MRSKIAHWLMHLAFRVEPKATIEGARYLVTAADWAAQMMAVLNEPQTKKRGRPLGSKDTKPRNKVNMGRPKGSKSKPKGWL
jgi:hypothetical protein